jgi:MYXO-CTERM domain-containing protein
LDVSFDITIGTFTANPTPNADGMTLTFADAKANATPILGATGGGLGFSGVTGVALAFDTFQDGTDPSANFIGLTKGPATVTVPDALQWLSTNTDVPQLATTPPVSHRIRAYVTGGVLYVSFDDKTKLTMAAANLPASVYVGFTDGTGDFTDRHAVSNISIVSDTLPDTSDAGVGGEAGATASTGGESNGGNASGGASTGSAGTSASAGTAGSLGSDDAGIAGNGQAGSNASGGSSAAAGASGEGKSGSSGCSCRTAPSSTGAGAPFAALALGAVLLRRRRRAARR